MIEKNEKNEQSKKKVDLSWLKKKRTLPVWMFILGAVFLMALSFHFGKAVITGFHYRNAIVTKSSLKKVLKISELSVLKYTYNAVATEHDEKGNDKYYVAYEGTVTAGVAFSKIDISIDAKEKRISITMPEIKIQETWVNSQTMEPLFKSEKDNQLGTHSQMYKLCKEDLKTRVMNDTEFLSRAEEGARSAVKSLIEKWVKQITGEVYQVIVQ